MPRTIFPWLAVVTIVVLFVSYSVDASESGFDAPRTPEGYGEASEVAPLPTVRTERIARYLAVVILIGVLALVGVAWVSRRRI